VWVRFEWDPKKERGNVKKHGLGFAAAKELLASGVDYLELYDDAHSEERFIAIGPVRRGVILVVYTERSEDTLRILSARPATPREVALYRKYMGSRP
jgi:uncharacterized DUF497 family protein